MTTLVKNPERVTIGNVIVFGAHLLHPKMLEMFEWGLKNTCENNLQAVFVSNTGPRDRVGNYNIPTQSLLISLPQICENALNESAGTAEDKGFSVNAQIWVGILWTFFHELHHNAAAMWKIKKDGDLSLTKDWWKEQDKLADEYGWNKMEECVIQCDGDVPQLDEIPFVSDVVFEFLTSESVNYPQWVRAVKDRMDKGIVFESKGACFDSLPKYFLETTKEPEKFEKENPGAALEMVMEQELPSLFDQRILPGQQGELFGKKMKSVSDPVVEAENNTINMVKGENNVYSGDNVPNGMDDVHDYLPPEAYGNGGEENFDDEVNGPEDYEDYGRDEPVAPQVISPPRFAKPLQTGLKDIIVAFWDRMNEALFSGADVEKTILPLTETEKALGIIIGTCIPKGKGAYDVTNVEKIGGIHGYYTPAAKVPMYDVLIKWNGVNRRFKLIAQNPDKNSPYAKRAKAGEKIAWLIEDIEGETNWRGVYENNVYRRLEGK